MPVGREIDEVEERIEEPLPSLSSRRVTPERELERLFSSYRAAQRRLEMEALRGGPPIDVSGYLSGFEGLDFEATLADKLADQIIARQLQADIVSRNVRKAERALEAARRDSDKQKFSTAFTGGRRANSFPRTVFGTDAWISLRRGVHPRFKTPFLALPCVERITRRQVLFAKALNKGYKVKHRRLPHTDFWC